MGRRPKPTALKILQGNPGKRPLPANEPKAPDGPVEKPRMRKGASVMWDRYAPLVEGMGLLTPVDVPLFALACALMAEAAKDPAGMVAARIARLESLSGRFGLSPADRAKLGATGKPKKNAFDVVA